MKNVLQFLFTGVIVFISITTAYSQGVTTSSVNGKITDELGEPLPGATVIAIHKPSGTQFGNISDRQGYYRIPNMRTGGPYKISVSFVGYQPIERDDIYLGLGQAFKLSVSLKEGATELQEILVVASDDDVFDGNRTGAETVLSLEAINNTPTVGRSIGDFARFTPQARIDEGSDGFEISVGGMNNRYNAIYIDGAVNNDVFGLAGSGTNGGQTGVSPYPIDAIEQFSISLAPFDVRQSGFAGASINAITRSGTNDFNGSAYYFFRNESMAGKTPAEDFEGLEREKLANFTAKTIGARIGGPIIKDKLFFFVNAEIQRDETPQPYLFSTYQGDADRTTVNNLINTLTNTYGYDPGTFENSTAFLNSDKVIAKFDYNLNETHKISLRHSYVSAENLEARTSSTGALRFENGSEYFVSKTNSTALEIKSNFANASNHFKAGLTFTRDDRDPFGDPFPSVTITDGDGEFILGAEPFSTANLLNQDVITLTNNYEIYKGSHTITIGANAEFFKAKNLFISFNYGNYEWDRANVDTFTGSNVGDFINGDPASTYFRNYSQVDNIAGDESASGVTFSSSLLGLYFQDEYQVTDNFKMTFGLRMDVQSFEDTPENIDFNENTLPLLEQVYDLKGAKTGEFIKPQIYFAPRLGFNLDVNGDQTTQLRGGIGIFTSRVPLVWPGGAFNNNGINLGGTFSTSEVFNPDINSQSPTDFDPNNLQRGGDVDLFASNFKIPQVLKLNAAVDKMLPGGITATVELLYNKFLNNLFYQNVNLAAPVGRLTGSPDDRFIYDGSLIEPAYNRVMLASNTSKGHTYNVSLSLKKNFLNGLNTNVSYSYGDAYNVFEGTSSQNSSQWRYRQTVSSRNLNDQVMRSQFAPGHRVLAQLSYGKNYGGNMGTRIGVVWEGRSGNPFSYLIGNANNQINVSDSRTPELAYIPADQSEINMPAADYAILDAIIEGDPYLSKIRGEYAERNGNRTSFETLLDIKLIQDFFIETANGKRNTLQLSLDIFNVGNMINKDWGKIYQREDSRVAYALYDFEGYEADGTTPIYSANSFTEGKAYYGDLDDAGIRSSRWQMQLGVRYIFQ